MLREIGRCREVRDVRVDESMHIVHSHVGVVTNRADGARREAFAVVAAEVGKELADDAQAGDMPSFRLPAPASAVLNGRRGQETAFPPGWPEERTCGRNEEDRGGSSH